MAQRLHFQNSNEVGVFAMLSNAYCLTAVGTSENFVRAPQPSRSLRATARRADSSRLLHPAPWRTERRLRG
jgi:translation initiation factor 6 (eIF-6)